MSLCNALHFAIGAASEGCEDYYIKVEGKKGPYTAKGNTTKQPSRVLPVTWTPKSRQGELNDLRLEQDRAQNRNRKSTWASNGQRYRRTNNTNG